jgi:GH15 family glucan-1,4-alpha-glucosidase
LLVTQPLCKTSQFREEYGYEEEGNRTVSYQPIENYGIIGNMRTVALVGMNGSIDWYCYPHFDSPSVFGAILDDKKGGRFQISADADGVRHKQFYWPSTNDQPLIP